MADEQSDGLHDDDNVKDREQSVDQGRDQSAAVGSAGDDEKGGRGQWTKEENMKFVEGARMFGARNWDKIAEYMTSRSSKQGTYLCSDVRVCSILSSLVPRPWRER